MLWPLKEKIVYNVKSGNFPALRKIYSLRHIVLFVHLFKNPHFLAKNSKSWFHFLSLCSKWAMLDIFFSFGFFGISSEFCWENYSQSCRSQHMRWLNYGIEVKYRRISIKKSFFMFFMQVRLIFYSKRCAMKMIILIFIIAPITANKLDNN